MPNKKIDIDPDLTLNYSFHDLYAFFVQREIPIEYEYIHDQSELLLFPKKTIRILKVSGFASIHGFRNHVRKLIDSTFELYLSNLLKKRKFLRISQIEGLIEELEEYIDWIFPDFESENNTHKRFAWYKLEGKNVEWVITDYERINKILINAEPYVLSSIDLFNELKQRLLNTKHDFDSSAFKFNHITSPIKSYKYIHYSLDKNSIGYIKMNELWEGLKHEPKYIAENTSFANFHRIFSGMEVKVPIEWINPNINTLHYFITIVR